MTKQKVDINLFLIVIMKMRCEDAMHPTCMPISTVLEMNFLVP